MHQRTEKDKMLAGELYDPRAPEIQADLAATHNWLARYNAALDMIPSERRKLLLERLASVGDGAVIRPPFHCDYGFNIRLGAGVFLNFNCVILDVVEVAIGDSTQIGPGVHILAADHPRDPAGRASGLEFGRPIRIGCNVWIGAGAIILPGVTIGDDALIGCGQRCHPRRACRGYGLRQSGARTRLDTRLSAKHSPMLARSAIDQTGSSEVRRIECRDQRRDVSGARRSARCAHWRPHQDVLREPDPTRRSSNELEVRDQQNGAPILVMALFDRALYPV
jgi:maltose O-acetyltransferase